MLSALIAGCLLVTFSIICMVLSLKGFLYPIPKARGTIRVPGILAEVEVIRDSIGVPHIFAKSIQDALFGLGFVHGEDRRLQMELTRKYLRGELAELTGEGSLTSDRLMRTLGFARSAEDEAFFLSPEDRVLHKAYVDGVNAASEQTGWPRGILPKLLNVGNSPWTIADSLIILKLNVLSSSQYVEELLMCALIREVGKEKFHWFIAPNLQNEYPTIIGSLPNSSYDICMNLLASILPQSSPSVGSNSWVIRGERTVTGSPYLASDPHMPLTAPSGIYAAHLISPELEVTGVTIPGIPAFLYGHNRRIAWGMTAAGTDSQDLFLEEIDEAGAARVRTAQGWVPLRVQNEEIKVRGRTSPLLYQARSSSHGPLISDAYSNLLRGLFPNRGVTKDASHNYALALANPFIGTSRPGWYFALARAQDWMSFREALRNYSGCGSVFVYADKDGQIGYQLADRIPVRQGTVPLTPVLGWENSHEWIGEVSFDELPHALDPPEMIFATANNPITDPGYHYFLGFHWGDLPWRVNRIRKRLATKPKFSLQDLAEIQLDVVQDSMVKLVAWSNMAQSSEPEILEFQQQLSAWDLKADVGSLEQTLAEAFRMELMREVFRPHLSQKLFDAYVLYQVFSGPALEWAMSDPNAAMFGKDPSEAKIQRAAAVTHAIKNSTRRLHEMFGPDRSRWVWGQTHQLVFRSPLVKSPGIITYLLRRSLNIGSFPAAGSNTTVNLGWWIPQQLFSMVSGPGYRQLIDLDDFSRSLYLPPAPGQSERPASKHFKDLAEPWARGAYFPMLWTKEQIQGDAREVKLLVPVDCVRIRPNRK